MRFLKKNFLILVTLLPTLTFSGEPLAASKRSPFFVSPILNYYGGQNLELLNDDQPYDSYSFIQYIADFGTHFMQQLTTKKPRFLTLDAVLRIKGNLGNASCYAQTSETPVKIGWGTTETAHNHAIDKFLFWLKEGAVTYSGQQSEKTFFKVGLFPYKLGNGLTLGNAYKIIIPIPGQFIYEQIDQFRPGLMGKITSQNDQLSGSLYLGIMESKCDSFINTGQITNAQNLETPFFERGPGKGNILFTAELTFMPPTYNNGRLTLNPYFLLNANSNQMVEFPGDASSKLFTPGIYALYEKNNISINVECAHNFGHQQVKAWDRNQLIHTNDILNTHLFYTPDQTLTLETVTDADFVPSPLIIRPESIAQGYGNGTNFLYSPTPGATFIFKNSYDRLRKRYTNTYTGFMIYSDILFTFKQGSVGIAGGCASGDNNPNDSLDTIAMTRLTPNITYNDYNKNYHGFFGINQLYEGKSINPLYFGQAQKLNQPLSLNGQLTTPLFTNQCFLGTTVRGHTQAKNGILYASGTIVTYFEQRATKKGLSATLWQAQSLDFTPQMQTDMNTVLPKSLGTEVNWSATYTLGTDLSFSVLGAVFIPGSYYTQASGKLISLAQQAQLAQTDFAPDQNRFTPALGNNVSFFINVQFTCLFDLSHLQNPFNTLKESYA